MYVRTSLLAHEGHVSAKKFFTSGTAASYDLVSFITTFGQDRVWKRQIVEISRKHDTVLDLACGTGILSSMISARGASVTGLDLTFEYLIHRRISPICQGTAEILPFKDCTFNAVVSSYLAKYVNVRLTVGECWRVLQPGGVVVFHDFACPDGPMYKIWVAYFAILRGVGVFSKSWKPVFAELDKVICRSQWVEKVYGEMKEQGFQDITIKRQTLGTAAIVWGYKP